MKFGVGVIGTSGGLGILIPPSIVMVIYAVSTNASIGRLFIAGIIPGILLASLLMFVTWFVAHKRNYPRLPKASFATMLKALRDCIWGLLLIVVVIGGIYSGIFTATEAAAMSAVYAFVVSVFVYRDMGLKDVPKTLLASANMSSMILYIITNAVLFSFLLTSEQIPQQLTEWITGLGLGSVGFLIMVNLLLLAAGNFMEPSSILLITAPLLFPMAMQLGIDPIHLGVLMTVNMEIGMITPPVGLNLYVASGISRLGLTETTKACAPWILVMLAYLVLITYVPIISLWLPNLLMK
jgi:C4-dicarboxylate transporter DctM subunit